MPESLTAEELELECTSHTQKATDKTFVLKRKINMIFQ